MIMILFDSSWFIQPPDELDCTESDHMSVTHGEVLRVLQHACLRHLDDAGSDFQIGFFAYQRPGEGKTGDGECLVTHKRRCFGKALSLDFETTAQFNVSNSSVFAPLCPGHSRGEMALKEIWRAIAELAKL